MHRRLASHDQPAAMSPTLVGPAPEARLAEPRVEVLQHGSWLQMFSPAGFAHRRVHLPIDSLPEALAGLRVLHLTDLHMRDRWYAGYEQMLARIAADPPGLILFTGDFLESRLLRPRAIENVRQLMGGLRSRLGTFAILGNHDGDLLAPLLAAPETAAKWNLELIDRRRVVLRSDEAALELIGLPGVDRFDVDDTLFASIPPRDPNVPRLVLGHFPDSFPRIAALRPSIYFAGHTHGGQCCLPGGVPLPTHDSLPRRFAKGIHRIDDTWLIVSRGIGYASLPLRTFCSMEMMEIVLAPAAVNGQ